MWSGVQYTVLGLDSRAGTFCIDCICRYSNQSHHPSMRKAVLDTFPSCAPVDEIWAQTFLEAMLDSQSSALVVSRGPFHYQVAYI